MNELIQCTSCNKSHKTADELTYLGIWPHNNKYLYNCNICQSSITAISELHDRYLYLLELLKRDLVKLDLKHITAYQSANRYYFRKNWMGQDQIVDFLVWTDTIKPRLRVC